MKISRVRKVPQFPQQKGHTLSSFFQLLISVFIWIIMILLFAIGAWAMWFGKSLSYLIGKPHNIIPWWFSWMCIFLLFPITALVILVAEFAKMIQIK